MKKNASTLVLLLSFLPLAFMAQETKRIPCYTDEAMEQYFASNPEARTSYQKHLNEVNATQLILEQQQANAKSASSAPEYTVPVVFHILYDCENPNLGVTDNVCIAALNQVNSDFSRNGADTNLIFAPFKSLYINSDIKFMLAKKDPQGNCINGIVRHYDTKTIWSQGSANGNSAYWTYTWDPTKYLNIYVVTSIVPQGTVTGNGVIVGYTFRPGTWATGNTRDAIVYDGDYLSGSQSGIADARSLSHEIGHWLDLAHTFGSTNNPGVVCGSTTGGDGISDTPDTKGNFSNCPASSTNTAYTCTSPNPSNANNYYQNVNNFMDYSSCSRNFTAGQTLRMRTTLGNTTNGRNNLSSLSNLAFTGVDGSGVCAPKADFASTNCAYTVCAGSSLSFKDLSFNGTVSSYAWSANNGGVVANASASITSIMFPNVGTSFVTLMVTNGQGSSSKSLSVTVVDGVSGIIGPYSESFEIPGIPTDWQVFNTDNDAVTWTQTELAAFDLFASFWLHNYNTSLNKTDILQMPTLDLLNNQGKILEFAYAYRQRASNQNDEFRVQASKDCGGTWTDIWYPNIASLANGSGGVSSDEFIPFPEEWKVYQLNSSPYWFNFTNSSSVIIRFVFKSGSTGYANNMFIDAARFYDATGVNELSNQLRFNLRPNPSNGATNVNFNLNDAASIKISVMDIMGREVISPVNSNYAAGEHSVLINESNTLSNGVYFVNLYHNGAVISSKLIIQ